MASVAVTVCGGLLLTACILLSDQSIENNPNDPRAQDLIDRIRSIDLMPRETRRTPDTATVGTSQDARPAIFVGEGTQSDQPGQAGQAARRGAMAEIAPNGEGFELNFENAQVSTIAKVILGDILRVGYTIDPRVQGTVSLASGRPVPKSDLLFVLENTLRMSGVALARDRGGYRIVPAPDAVGTGGVDRAGMVEPGYGVSVVPLRHVSAQTIMKLLDGFGLKANAVRVDPAHNMLLVQGSGPERRAATETILNFDANWMRGQSVGIFPVRNSAPETLVAELEKIMDSGEGGLGQGMVKFQAIGRLNAVLVVSRKPEYLKSAGTWVARLDKSNMAGTNLKVYRLRYGSARQIAGLLNEMLVGRGSGNFDSTSGNLAPGSGATASTSGGPLAALSAQPNVPGGAAAAGQRPGAAGADPQNPDASREFGSRVGAGGALPNIRITADTVNNTILVYANAETHRVVEQTIRQVDRPQLQVSIDSTIAEITLNDNLNYGVQFFLTSKDLGLGTDKGSILNTIGKEALNRVLPGFNFLVGSEASPRMILDALHAYTEVKVLSNPSVVVLDNQTATLQVGDQIPVSTGTATVLTGNNTIVSTIDYRNTGIILRVVPRVNSNGTVVLDIEQEISNVATTSTTTATLTPTVSQRKVKSSISVNSGQTVLLAGLISERLDRPRQGIPVLDQIPVLGDAFSHQNNTKARTELIIFIRPTVIRDAIDAHAVAEELRSKFKGSLVGTNLPVPERPPPTRYR